MNPGLAHSLMLDLAASTMATRRRDTRGRADRMRARVTPSASHRARTAR